MSIQKWWIVVRIKAAAMLNPQAQQRCVEDFNGVRIPPMAGLGRKMPFLDGH